MDTPGQMGPFFQNAHDVLERDALGPFRQGVTSVNAAPGGHHARSLKRRNDIAQVFFRHILPPGDIAEEHGPLALRLREILHQSHAIPRPRRQSHVRLLAEDT